MSVSVLLHNVCGSIGEGPHWDQASQSLMFVDIMKGGVHKWNYSTRDHAHVNLEKSVSFVTPSTKGDLMIGYGRDIARLNWDTKVVTSLHEVDQGTKNRFNDGKCDPSGRLWAGTMGYEESPGKPELESGSLYSLSTSGQLKRHVKHVNISNGMAWSLDNKTMFYIDSVPKKVYAFDFDIVSGDIVNQRDCIVFGDDPRFEMNLPDGMCMDTNGHLWVACHGSGRVAQFDPQTGQEIREVLLPDAPRTTSCCFGGPNLDELFVTCARPLPTEPNVIPTANAGSVFRVTGLGVRGVPMHNYQG